MPRVAPRAVNRPLHPLPLLTAGSSLAMMVVLAVAGCGRPSVVESDEGVLVVGEFEETATESRTLDLGGRTLVVEGENGAVSLNGGAGDVVDLRFHIRARGDSREEARNRLEGLLLEESGDEISYVIDIQPDRSQFTNVDVSGTIPHDAELRLILRSGDVTLTNLDGRIDVLIENGDISFLGGSSNLTLATRNGDVAADFYRLGSGDTVELATTNGDVSLGLGAAATAAVSANTRAGRVRTNGFVFQQPRLSQRGAGARFSGSVGAQGASVNMKTQNGDLLFSTNAALPPVFEEPPAEEAAPDDTTMVAPDTTTAPATTDPKTVRRVDTVETTTPFSGAGRDADSTGTGIER